MTENKQLTGNSYMTPVEGPYPYEHAVRRSWFTGMMWSL